MHYVTEYLMELYNILPDVELPEFNLGTLGLILITAGVVAGTFSTSVTGTSGRVSHGPEGSQREETRHVVGDHPDASDARLEKGLISSRKQTR